MSHLDLDAIERAIAAAVNGRDIVAAAALATHDGPLPLAIAELRAARARLVALERVADAVRFVMDYSPPDTFLVLGAALAELDAQP